MRARIFPGLLLLGFTLASAISCGAQVPASKQVPAWASDAVWYQIFPERFRNGDPKNDPPRTSLETPLKPGLDWAISSWTADWYARDAWEEAIGPGFYRSVLDRRYGGDLQGVLDKLDYLKNLGINALYFNPLFYARSLHKYDGNSYHHIDPYFGPDPAGDFALIHRETSDPATWHWTSADQLFLQVIKQAHSRGIKVIIDGVFNHTGRDFFAFQDLLENQQKSPYRDWYVVRSFDDPATKRNEFDYDGWWGHKTLPVFAATRGGRDMAPGPKAYIFNATRRWMDPEGKGDPANGIDGWRLDVADERPTEFWAEWNAYVRKINPQAYTTAETWKDPRPMIVAGGFSATMNYFGFAIPVKGWLVDNHLTPSSFAQKIDQRRIAVPRADAYVMQNLIDSHDTDRLASMIVNGERIPYHDPDQVDYNVHDDLKNSPDYLITKPDDRARAIQRLVVLMQMTYVGAPMIYYGDEAGMWGAGDPDNRQPMVWADLPYAPQAIDPRTGSQPPQTVGFDQEMFAFYRSAVALRHAHPALDRGDYALLDADDTADSVVFLRRGPAESLIVAINRSGSAQQLTVPVPVDLGAALLAKPAILFSTTDPATAAEVTLADGKLSLSLPPLTGVVIGAAR